MLDVAHALVVADGQRQEGDEHEAAVEHVAIEEIERIRDAQVLGRFVDVIDEGIDPFGEVVGGRDFDVGAGRRFGGEMRGGFEVAGAGLRFHLVSAENVLSALDQVLFLQAEVGVTLRLIHGVFPRGVVNAERASGELSGVGRVRSIQRLAVPCAQLGDINAGAVERHARDDLGRGVGFTES